MTTEGADEPTAAAFMDELERAARGERPWQWPQRATARERALLDYALALTVDPSKMTAAMLLPLREVGLDDAEILDANQVTAYFAYANRVADGLGVALEDPPPP